MEITQQLINNFFQNRCSPAEVDAVVIYFSENKEALEEFMGKEEWDAIAGDEYFNAALSQKILASITQKLFAKQVARIIPVRQVNFRRIVAAASVILLAGTSLWYIQKVNNKRTIAINSINTKAIHSTANINWQTKNNTVKNSIAIKLEDGSTVTLFKNSVIRYPQPFTGNTRALHLNGAAFFEVAKNRLKPFIVYTGNLSTTALGTSFKITAFNEGNAGIRVKLVTGKVVVKSIKKTPDWNKDIFLLPGEQLSYNAQSGDMFVAKSNSAKEQPAKVKAEPKNSTINTELNFKNTSLTEVMNQLSVLYGIKISCMDADLHLMNFTGVINKRDDICAILKVIAQMNDLKIVQTPGGFNVTRPTKL